MSVPMLWGPDAIRGFRQSLDQTQLEFGQTLGLREKQVQRYEGGQSFAPYKIQTKLNDLAQDQAFRWHGDGSKPRP
ncbi:MAG: hypothetical protein DWQ01_09810 [Planctomycetota bacterium]|nr:MAG: hypothetical protein DWQ01_09810 [Planctomycetota bacterium]